MKNLLARVLAIVVLGTLPAAAFGTKESTSVQTDDVYIIVNGDDVGLAANFTDAVFDAYFSGNISSASLYAPGADADRAIAILQEKSTIPIGVHLTLTGDVPPLTAGPSLRQANGNMWDTEQDATRMVTPDDAEAEWEAQIRKVMEAGLIISHLDSHMGCYFWSPELFARAYSLSRKYKIPLIAPYYPGFSPPGSQKHLLVSSYTGIYTLPDDMEETTENRDAAYRALLNQLEPGIHYLFTHPGFRPEDGNLWGDLALRVNDTSFWGSPSTGLFLAEQNIQMCGPDILKRP